MKEKSNASALAPACADSRYWRGGAIRDDARTFGEDLRRSTVAHFARKVSL